MRPLPSATDFAHKLKICLKELRESYRGLLLIQHVPLLRARLADSPVKAQHSDGPAKKAGRKPVQSSMVGVGCWKFAFCRPRRTSARCRTWRDTKMFPPRKSTRIGRRDGDWVFAARRSSVFKSRQRIGNCFPSCPIRSSCPSGGGLPRCAFAFRSPAPDLGWRRLSRKRSLPCPEGPKVQCGATSGIGRSSPEARQGLGRGSGIPFVFASYSHGILFVFSWCFAPGKPSGH